MPRQQKKSKRKGPRARRTPLPYSFAGDGNTALHLLFQQQAERVINAADASQDEKQEMLMAMNCPCCGLGGTSFSIRLGRAGVKTRFFADDGGSKS